MGYSGPLSGIISLVVRENASEFIKRNGILTLATQSKEGPWVSTLYYGVGEDLSLFIVTDPNSIHAKDFVKNNQVAFNIFDSHQKIYNPKEGIQGSGNIEIVKGIPNVIKALSLWHKQNPGIEKKITIKEIKKLKDTKVFRITPTYLKHFNEKIYAPEEYGVWEDKS